MTRAVLALALLGCHEVDDDTGDDLPWEPRFDGVAEAALADLAASGAAAVSVALMQDGEIVFAQAFGSAHPDEDRPVGPDTLFQIGSITKQMTATTVLQKVEDGALSLDDTLVETVPDLVFARNPAWSAEITLDLQLSHQTGLYDTVPWAEDDPDDAGLATYTTTTFAAEEFQMNPAGLFFNYSNPNFVLAGLAVEGVDDRAWPDVVEQDVFAPLGMARTFARKAPVEADGDYAVGPGYIPGRNGTFSYGTVEMDDVTDFAWIRPAGLVWSTPSDLLRWATFLVHGDPAVLSDDLRADLTTARAPYLYGPEGVDGSYGYGVSVSPGFFLRGAQEYVDVPLWSHSGATLSFSSALLVLPDRDAAVAVIASGYGAGFTETIARALEVVGDLPEPRATPPAYSWNPARLDDHVGTYEDPNNVGTMIVTRQDDKLFVEMPDLEAFGYDVAPQLAPLSDTVFYLTVDDVYYDLTFIGEPGQPTQYVRNRIFVLARDEATTAR